MRFFTISTMVDAAIQTIENPIEYSVSGLRQTQIDTSTNGADMSRLIRGAVRQGPDVLMIGEVTDSETAATVVNAANSGRLVIVTVNSPFATVGIQQFLNLGVQPYFLSSALLGVVAQRLVRTLSDQNRIPMDLSAAPRTFEEVQGYLEPGEGKVVYAAADGTTPDECYQGMTGVFEILPITRTTRRMISEACTAGDIAQKAIDEGMLDFRRSALLKVAHGLTSFDEMQRIVPLDEVE